MTENNGGCQSSGCGHPVDTYSTDKICPLCGKRLRLAGRALLMELRLNCQYCGFQSPPLSQEELREVL